VLRPVRRSVYDPIPLSWLYERVSIMNAVALGRG
jgi:hypothetical protein